MIAIVKLSVAILLFDAVSDAQSAVHGAECLNRVEIALEQSAETIGEFSEQAPAAAELPVGSHVKTPLHVAHVLVKVKVASVTRLVAHLNLGADGSPFAQVAVVGPTPEFAAGEPPHEQTSAQLELLRKGVLRLDRQGDAALGGPDAHVTVKDAVE